MDREMFIREKRNAILRANQAMEIMSRVSPDHDPILQLVTHDSVKFSVNDRREAVQLAKEFPPVKAILVQGPQKGRLGVYALEAVRQEMLDDERTEWWTEILPWTFYKHPQKIGAELCWFTKLGDIVTVVTVEMKNDPAEMLRGGYPKDFPLGEFQKMGLNTWGCYCWHEENGFDLWDFLNLDRPDDEPKFYGVELS